MSSARSAGSRRNGHGRRRSAKSSTARKACTATCRPSPAAPCRPSLLSNCPRPSHQPRPRMSRVHCRMSALRAVSRPVLLPATGASVPKADTRYGAIRRYVSTFSKCVRCEASIDFIPDQLPAFHVPSCVHLHTGPDRRLSTCHPVLLEDDQRVAVRHAQVQMGCKPVVDDLLYRCRGRIGAPFPAVARDRLDGHGFGPKRHCDCAANRS